MASLNPLTKELVFKVVFYGPGLGGKTTTLQYIHASTKPEHRGKMVSLATPMDRTLYFDFLPLRIPRVRGMAVRLQLFTVPGQVYYGATRKLVLTGADGVVFVADSQNGRQDANQESLEDLAANLGEHNRALAQVPHTFHWNKRDLGDLLSIEELEHRYNVHGAPALGTIATQGEGVFSGLERITSLVLRAYEADLPRSERSLDTSHGKTDESGIADAIRGLAESADPPRTTPAGPTPSAQEAAKVSPPPAARPRNFQAEPPTATEETSPLTPSPATHVPSGDDLRKTLAIAAPAPSAGVSFVELWPESDREGAREAEAALAARQTKRALLATDALLTRTLASAAGLAGTAEAPRDPALAALLLGLQGPRYLAFRAAVRAARQGEMVSDRDALEGYAFALEARRARDAIDR